MTLNINVENKTVVRIMVVVLALTLGLAAVAKMRASLTLVGISIFLALAFNPAVSWITRHLPGRGKHRAAATGIAFVAVLAFVIGILWLSVPPLVREGGNFARTLPQTIENFRYRNEKVASFIDRYDLQPEIDKAVENAKNKASSYTDNLLSSVGKFLSSIVSVISVLVMTFLFLIEGPKWANKIPQLMRNDHTRKRTEDVFSKMHRVVTGYVNGQLLVALVAALFALGFMLLVRIPYPAPLALIVFFFGLIPMVGNTIAAILVSLTALILKDAPAALIMLAFFVIYQQLENISLQPMIQSKTTSLSPLIVFVSVILGVGLMGPIGGLVAIPMAGCAKVLLLDYLEHRNDGDVTPKGIIQRIKDKAVVKQVKEAKKGPETT